MRKNFHGVGDGPQLLGRARELGKLTDLLTSPPSGAAVLLSGDPGTGKSSMINAAYRSAHNAGYRVLMTGGVDATAWTPFSGLHQLLMPVLDRVPALPRSRREELDAAFGGSAGTRPAFDTFQVGLAALALLAEVAAERQIALLVDDVQWLDRHTEHTIAFLARRIAAHPVVLIGAVRTGHTGPLVTAGLPECLVGPLDENASRELLRTHAGELPTQRRNHLLRVAQGNPLALVELPKVGEVSGEHAEPDPDVTPLTCRLARSFVGRLTRLPAPAGDAVLVAAAGHGGELAEVLAAANVLTGQAVAPNVLDPVRCDGLLTVDHSRVRFRHPLVRSAVLASEPMHRRLAAHAALAQVLTDPVRRAWHRAQSITEPDAAVADELVAGIQAAGARGLPPICAARGWERAAALTPDPARRGHRLLVAAEHAFDLGQAEVVDQLIKEATAGPLGPLDQVRVQWLREITHDGVPGGIGRILEMCAEAGQAAAAGDRDLALNLLLGAALRCWLTDIGRTAGSAVVTAARSLHRMQGDPRWLAAVAVAEPIREAAAVLDRLSATDVSDVEDADALRLLGTAAYAVGHSSLAAAFLDKAEVQLRSQGRLGLLPQVLATLVDVRLNLGRWDDADEAAEDGRRLAVETGRLFWGAGGLVGKARMAALRGHHHEALRLAAQVEQASSGMRLNDLLSCAQLVRGTAWVAAGRYDEAYSELRRMFDPGDPAYHHRECFSGLMLLADAAVRTGHEAEATRIVDELAQVAAGSPAPNLHVHLHYARAVLAPDESAERHYHAALREDLAHWPWIRSRIELSYGSWLRRQRQVLESRRHLRSALANLTQIGAVTWAEQARAELRAAGELADPLAPGVSGLLSPQELQIARLAAEGLSNRDIGRQLYLSPRTVGTHLYRIFPKLQVTSRVQLAHRLRATA